jgi:hypothetical protein
MGEATNHFGDEFMVLYAVLPLATYEQLRLGKEKRENQIAFRQIAETISEIGPYIRFIAIDLQMETGQSQETGASSDGPARRLQRFEIEKLVNLYIGVSAGYLGDFSYQSHRDFYVELDLDIDPDKHEGTTRWRFFRILSESPASVQTRILEGILRRYPVGSSALRTQERCDEIRNWIARLKGVVPIEKASLRISSQVVERALADAEQLLRTTGATSAVDRLHTALHGYLKAVCDRGGIQREPDDSMTELFKLVREEHPAFRDVGPRSEDTGRILRALSAIVDAVNTLRNRASVAHPNESLLAQPEAMLVINATRSILHFLDEKLHRHSIGLMKKED